MKDEILKKVAESIELANRHLGMKMQIPTVSFDLWGTTSGKAYSMRWHLQFNLELAQSNPDEFLKQTVPHEVAHLAADMFFGVPCRHGPRWKSIMVNTFGLSPRRCHNYDTSGVRKRKTTKFRYLCPCGEDLFFGANIRKKIILGRRYFCRKCKTPIPAIPEKMQVAS